MNERTPCSIEVQTVSPAKATVPLSLPSLPALRSMLGNGFDCCSRGHSTSVLESSSVIKQHCNTGSECVLVCVHDCVMWLHTCPLTRVGVGSIV